LVGSGVGLTYFQWSYDDNGGITPQAQSQIQITTLSDPGYASPVVGSPGVGQTIDGSVNQYLSSVGTVAMHNHLVYGTLYIWRVRVQDANSAWSDWVDGAAYVKAGHPAPYPRYQYSPATPKPGGTVSFLDDGSANKGSLCYNNLLQSYSCAINPSSVYTWSFGTGQGSASGAGGTGTVTTSHTYSVAKTNPGYSASLQVCDELGQCCSIPATIPVSASQQNSLPNWKEVSPFY
jgi:hypothetical protein